MALIATIARVGGKAIATKVAKDTLTSKVKGAETAPSATLPGVLRKSKPATVAAPKKSNIIQFPGNRNAQPLRATPLSRVMNAFAQPKEKDSCCDQSSQLLKEIKQNTDPANDNEPNNKCCEVGNATLGSIDETLKKMLTLQQQGIIGQREADAEAQDKPAPGLGGIKEMAKDKAGDLFGFLVKATIMTIATNLKPIAKAIGDATKAFTSAVGNFVGEAGKLWDSTTKTIGDWWSKTSKDVGDWWNKTTKDVGNWWDGLMGKKPEDSPTPTPRTSATTPSTAASRATPSNSAGTAAGVISNTPSSFSDVIQKAESGKASYNAYNKLDSKTGKYVAGETNFGKLTLDQVMARQAQKHMFAVGKYQITPKTLAEAKTKLGLRGQDNFDAKMQERIFNEFLAGSKRPALAAYRSGKSNDLNAAMLDAAKEWRGLPDPNTGRTYADKAASVNKANVSLNEVRAALQADRAKSLAAMGRVEQAVAAKPTPQNNTTVVQAGQGGQRQAMAPTTVPSPDGNNWLRSAEQFSHG